MPEKSPSPEQGRVAYWRSNLRLLAILLSVWFLCSHVAGIWLADWLDQFEPFGSGLGLGFWFAQQGSIYIFIALIAIYVVAMNRLDHRLLDGEAEASTEASNH